MIKKILFPLVAFVAFTSCSKTIVLADFTDTEVVKSVWTINPGGPSFSREGINIVGTPGMCSTTVDVKPNRIYQFVAKIKFTGERPTDRLIIDLHKGPTYDNAEQEIQILPTQVNQGEVFTAKKTFKSGNAPAMPDLRLYSFSKNAWTVESFELIQR